MIACERSKQTPAERRWVLDNMDRIRQLAGHVCIVNGGSAKTPCEKCMQSAIDFWLVATQRNIPK